MMRKRLTHLILVAFVNFGVQSAAFAADDALLTPSIFINQRTALIIPVNWAAGNGSPGAPQNKTVLDVVIQFEIALDCQQPTTRNGSSACDAAVSPSAFATCSFLARFNFIERTYKAMGEDSRIDPSQYLLIVSAEYGDSKELLGGSSCRMLRKLLQ